MVAFVHRAQGTTPGGATAQQSAPPAAQQQELAAQACEILGIDAEQATSLLAAHGWSLEATLAARLQ